MTKIVLDNKEDEVKEEEIVEEEVEEEVEDEVEEEEEEVEEVDEDEEEVEDEEEEKEEEPKKKPEVKKEEAPVDIDPDDILNLEPEESVEDLREKFKALQEENEQLKTGKKEEDIPDYMKITDEELEEMAIDDPAKAMRIQGKQIEYRIRNEQQKRAEISEKEKAQKEFFENFRRQANVASINLMKKAGIEPNGAEGIKIRKMAAELAKDKYFRHNLNLPDGNLNLIAIAGFSMMGELLAEQKKKLLKKSKKKNPRKHGVAPSGIASSGGGAQYNKGRVSIGL